MAKNLVTAWIEKGGWFDTFKLNPLNLIRGRGLSGHEGLSELIKAVIKPCTHSEKKDIEVRIIITPLNGVEGNIGDKPATTFEKVVSFTGEDFDTEEGLARIFQVTLAACSFPGIFSSVNVAGLGPCVDGGAVNNAPIRYAIDYIDVSHIIMPVPFPEMMQVPKSMGGFGLLGHLIEILINERLYRDLKTAQTTNADVKALKDMVKKNQLSNGQFEEIKKLLNIKTVNIHEVRPKVNLKVGSFSGFFSKSDRMKLVEEGREAMRAKLDEVKTT
jgi:predicted acylesterase/phospholipase RssA